MGEAGHTHAREAFSRSDLSPAICSLTDPCSLPSCTTTPGEASVWAEVSCGAITTLQRWQPQGLIQLIKNRCQGAEALDEKR